MEKDLYNNINFFYDGDALVKMSEKDSKACQDLLSSDNYTLIINKKGECPKAFFERMSAALSKVEGKQIFISLRTIEEKRDIQHEIEVLIDFTHKISYDKCAWTIIEDYYCKKELQVGILVSN